ncbi:MAG TPA: ATP-binding protein [Acidimicrobiales bacterium]|jgi:Histidine kinase-like ATPase domain
MTTDGRPTAPGGAGGAGGAVVELSIPVQADLVVLARLTAATVASRAGFGIEEVEDLRLAVEELCLSLVGPDDEGRLRFAYQQTDDAVTITCTFEPEEAGEPEGPGGPEGAGESGGAGQSGGTDRSGTGGDTRPEEELSLRILDALVDEHGRDGDGRGAVAWLRKRRALQSI